MGTQREPFKGWEMTEYMIIRKPGADPTGARASSDIDAEIEVVDLNSESDLNDLVSDPAVSMAVPDMAIGLHEPMESSATASGRATWGVEAVGALDSTRKGAGATVAVLDTGIDRDHVAFDAVRSKMIEKDFTGDGNGDPHGHGTHCAGTIFGGDVNGVQIGVAPEVDRVLIGKVLGNSGGGGTLGIANAIFWAVNQGANVVSMSLGIDFPGQVKRLIEKHDWPEDLAASRALEDYRNNLRLFQSIASIANATGPFGKPSVLIAASGNESKRQLDSRFEIAVAPPAAADDIIAVGAVGRSGSTLDIADFSNTNVDVVGPGVDVVSAKTGGGLKALRGTSMATPHAAGVAALWVEDLIASGQNLTAEAIRAKLIGSGTRNGFASGAAGARVGTGLVMAPA